MREEDIDEIALSDDFYNWSDENRDRLALEFVSERAADCPETKEKDEFIQALYKYLESLDQDDFESWLIQKYWDERD